MKCHICDKPTKTFICEKTNIHYYQCLSCEYIFKSPEYYQNLEKQKERYNLHQNNEDDAGYIAYFQRYLDFILPLVGEPKCALDFGCGCSSLLATLLESKGISCDYYDPIYHPHTLKRKKSYDLIVSTEVFEHLHQPREVFESLVDKLNTGGFLAIQTEFHTNDPTSFATWWYPKDTTHIVFFRAHTFKVLSEMYGCRVIKDNGKNMVVLQKC